MPSDVIMTREVAPLPARNDNAHKGEVGRIVVIGGCAGETLMLGAPALTANAAFRSGCGLVQMLLPESLRAPATVLAPCATARTMPVEVEPLLEAVQSFSCDVVALGPGLGNSLSPDVVAGFVKQCTLPMVIDADGINLLAEGGTGGITNGSRIVMTPHPGEMHRLLTTINQDIAIDDTVSSRREAACTLSSAVGCTMVLKGRNTIVTDGHRLYMNETGNAGMATGGTGDVLTGVIAALIGQALSPFEAAILGVYLHGLAGDFAAEELGRLSMTAMDLIEYLPEAFSEHAISSSE